MQLGESYVAPDVRNDPRPSAFRVYMATSRSFCLNLVGFSVQDSGCRC